MYPDPDKFDPDRYDESRGDAVQADPRQWVFGFGRRICPGMHIAEASIFIQVAITLAVFDILRDVDENGDPIVPVPDYTTAIVTYVSNLVFASIEVAESILLTQVPQGVPIQTTTTITGSGFISAERSSIHRQNMKQNLLLVPYLVLSTFANERNPIL